MHPHSSTTPFGRRSLTLAHVAAQATAKARPPEKVVHKWQVFRAICAAKARIGISERALAVLDALLSFHPETTLSGEGLVVFPSNRQLSLRAHGMAPATLRRHLAALVDAGLIIRRDSPNGKRFARKGQSGEIEIAFGFELAPLAARAEEFEALAAEVRAEEVALRLVRERISLCRRDIAKMIAAGIENEVPAASSAWSHIKGRSARLDWASVHELFRGIVERIPRTATRRELEPIAEDLTKLAADLFNLLENHIKAKETIADESQIERHIQNSKPENLNVFEPACEEIKAARPASMPETVQPRQQTFSLNMALQACPDILDYARGGIENWRDFSAAAAFVRAMLGISPSAWAAAQTAMGEIPAAVAVAAILQKGAAISSAGGYLRELTRKAQKSQFRVGPMLMALISARQREKKRA